MVSTGQTTSAAAAIAAAPPPGIRAYKPGRINDRVALVQDYFLPVLIILWGLGLAAIAALA